MSIHQHYYTRFYELNRCISFRHIAEFELDVNIGDRYIRDMAITGEFGTLSVKGSDGKELFKTHNFEEKELMSLIVLSGLSTTHTVKQEF